MNDNPPRPVRPRDRAAARVEFEPTDGVQEFRHYDGDIMTGMTVVEDGPSAEAHIVADSDAVANLAERR